MGTVLIRFYEELNDWLPPGKRKRDFEVPLNGKETVREIIETLGVPAEQVDLLLVNGQSAALEEVVKEGTGSAFTLYSKDLILKRSVASGKNRSVVSDSS